ncbi:uncharacterized protein B0T15DRAFT_508800 [Chaetomium strumarium]|uniref:Uncharacterized protein n=1 Tax=Chaetomium strumarium TaxID=1170767 RepID=A0AAJ0GY85_9PEZI|nr:hypothetical protein B0T15DRAFT_508800 [Chaetomium strumarium]
MIKKSKQSLKAKRERRSSIEIESDSTITTEDYAGAFADFGDSVSMGDSVFQGDDEESMALISAASSDDFDLDRIKPLLKSATTDDDDALNWKEVYKAVTGYAVLQQEPEDFLSAAILCRESRHRRAFKTRCTLSSWPGSLDQCRRSNPAGSKHNKAGRGVTRLLNLPSMSMSTPVKCYSSGGSLERQEVYERIKQLLSGFDKVNDLANEADRKNDAAPLLNLTRSLLISP